MMMTMMTIEGKEKDGRLIVANRWLLIRGLLLVIQGGIRIECEVKKGKSVRLKAEINFLSEAYKDIFWQSTSNVSRDERY